MGLIAALNFTEGILKSKNCHKMKLLLLTALAAVAVAEPYYGYGYYGFPYGHQQAWPGVRAPGFSSTCFGCLGKRSADEAAPAEADKVFGSGHNSYVGQTVWGFPSKAKRSAEADPEAEAEAEAAPYYYGYYGHQLNWPSYYAPGFSSTVWGARGKRSAEPAYGYYGYPLDIMDTVMAPESPDILLVPLTPSEAP